jgi:peptide/nickel transport system substrate-binding protein
LIERMAAVDYVEIGKYPKLKGATVTGFADFYMPIFFNINHGSRARTPLGQDPRVREAFELAIDRNVINDIVYMGQHIPSNQWLAPDDPYYANSLPIPRRDVIKARELLTAAGATNLTVELMMVNSPEYRQVGELLQAMTGEAGFDLRLRPTEVGAMFQALRKGDFEAVMYANVGRGDPDTAVYPWLGCDGFLNDGQYCAPEVEKSLLEARTRFAPDERKRFYEDAAAGILHDRPAIYSFIRRFLYGHTARLSGFRPIPGGYIHLQGLKLN